MQLEHETIGKFIDASVDDHAEAKRLLDAHPRCVAKFRMGIDDQYISYLTSGKSGEEDGCAAVGLHARTAAQLYDAEARWEAITKLG